MCCVAGGIATQPSGTWLPITDATAGPAPPKGTRTMSSFAVILKSSADRSGVVPTPGVATLYFLPSFIVTDTRSCMVFAGTDGWATNTLGEAAILVTGTKLLYGSYGIFA